MTKVYAVETRIFKEINGNTETLAWSDMYSSKKKALAELHDYKRMGEAWTQDVDTDGDVMFFDPTPSQKARGVLWVKKEVIPHIVY